MAKSKWVFLVSPTHIYCGIVLQRFRGETFTGLNKQVHLMSMTVQLALSSLKSMQRPILKQYTCGRHIAYRKCLHEGGCHCMTFHNCSAHKQTKDNDQFKIASSLVPVTLQSYRFCRTHFNQTDSIRQTLTYGSTSCPGPGTGNCKCTCTGNENLV